MNKDSFTFSIQEAETLGIECAIVLAASKEMKISSSADNRILLLLKEKIPFLEEKEISNHLKRLISLKLISSEINSDNSDPSSKKNLYNGLRWTFFAL